MKNVFPLLLLKTVSLLCFFFSKETGIFFAYKKSVKAEGFFCLSSSFHLACFSALLAFILWTLVHYWPLKILKSSIYLFYLCWHSVLFNIYCCFTKNFPELMVLLALSLSTFLYKMFTKLSDQSSFCIIHLANSRLHVDLYQLLCILEKNCVKGKHSIVRL